MGIKDYTKKRDKLLMDQHFKCYHCKKPFRSPTEVQLAHRVIKSKPNIKLFGLEVIDHVDNLRATHSDSCNSGVIINRATHPLKAQQHISDIQDKIRG